jgi:hypothetical protein
MSAMSHYACKLCIWEKKLYGERFREAASWFHDPDELLSHFRAEHSETFKDFSKEFPSWPGILEDAQACADGYLVCCRGVEPAEGFQFTCYRCDATTYNIADLKNLYCLACGHRFENYYTDGPFQNGSVSE